MNIAEVYRVLSVEACIEISSLEENESSPGCVMAVIACEDDQEAEEMAGIIKAYGYGKNWMHFEKPIQEEDDYVFDFDVEVA